MDSRVLIGLLEVLGMALAPVAMVSALVHSPQIYERTVLVGRRMNLLAPPPLQPSGLPIQKLAADLRRLRPEARAPRAGVHAARQRRALESYDTALVATARALEVPTTLPLLPDGTGREGERVRLEQALTEAGLSWQVQES